VAPQESAKGWRWGEVVNASTQDFGAAYSTGFFVAMNKQKWNSLPPDIQKIFRDVNKEWANKNGVAWDTYDKESRDWMISQGKKIITLSPEENAKFAAAVRPMLNEYVENMKKLGLPGKEALDFCLAELKKLEK
jgi:TRAP-type transport system periplasmic protein